MAWSFQTSVLSEGLQLSLKAKLATERCFMQSYSAFLLLLEQIQDKMF